MLSPDAGRTRADRTLPKTLREPTCANQVPSERAEITAGISREVEFQVPAVRMMEREVSEVLQKRLELAPMRRTRSLFIAGSRR